LLKASQQRTVLILDLRQEIGYEGISQLAVGSWQLAVGTRKKKCLPPSRLTSSFLPQTASFFLLPSSLEPLPSL